MKKKIRLLLLLSMMLQIFSYETIFAASIKTPNETYKVNLIDEKIPKAITEYVNKCYKDIIETTCMYDESVDVENSNSCVLGHPFIIYDLDGEMEAVYYYPIIEDEKVVLLISAINTTEGVALSASEELVSALNEVQYVKNDDLIFYESDDVINARNTSKNYRMNYINDRKKIRNYKMLSFEEKSYRACIDEISEKISEIKVVDVNECKENSNVTEKREQYTPSFSVDNVTGLKGGRTCSLYNAQGQGAYGNCWAASVATIVNYLKGTNYTATQVCDRMGIGYNDGANIDQKKAALEAYGYTYKKTTSQLGFGTVRSNIDSKYPIAMSCFDATGSGHATTLYGYNVTSSGNYIVMHNSGTNATVTLLYKDSGTTFTYNSKTWTWGKSLSYK